MTNNGITHIFFDLDHTLWDFDKNSSLAFKRVFEKYKIEVPLADFIKVYEPINLQYWKKYREEQVTKEELRRGRLTDVFEVFELKYPLSVIDDLAISYIEELPVDNHLFEDTVEILEYLKDNYKLHIITNGFEEVQHLKLRNSGIQNYFMTVTSSEEAGVKKPNPVIFKTALQKAAAIPHQSIMIGDSFEADILGAEKVGMHTLFFNYKNELVEGSYLSINKLSEIKIHL